MEGLAYNSTYNHCTAFPWSRAHSHKYQHHIPISMVRRQLERYVDTADAFFITTFIGAVVYNHRYERVLPIL